ncbi:MAG: hypothetical protein WCW67_03390 [Candidatus Margulisiibacteriota bacterium]|jgi:hypothetical protein
MNKNTLWLVAIAVALICWVYGNTLTSANLALVFMLIVPGLVILSAMLYSSTLK